MTSIPRLPADGLSGKATAGHVGLLELFAAALIAGISVVNAAAPIAAWTRSRDPRFVILATAHLGAALLGGIWTWGQLPVDPPSYAAAGFPVLGIALAVVLLLLVASLWPRRS